MCGQNEQMDPATQTLLGQGMVFFGQFLIAQAMALPSQSSCARVPVRAHARRIQQPDRVAQPLLSNPLEEFMNALIR